MIKWLISAITHIYNWVHLVYGMNFLRGNPAAPYALCRGRATQASQLPDSKVGHFFGWELGNIGAEMIDVLGDGMVIYGQPEVRLLALRTSGNQE